MPYTFLIVQNHRFSYAILHHLCHLRHLCVCGIPFYLPQTTTAPSSMRLKPHADMASRLTTMPTCPNGNIRKGTHAPTLEGLRITHKSKNIVCRGGSSTTRVYGMEKADPPARRRGKFLPTKRISVTVDTGGSAFCRDKTLNGRPAPTKNVSCDRG
jgi:hypothetical protein